MKSFAWIAVAALGALSTTAFADECSSLVRLAEQGIEPNSPKNTELYRCELSSKNLGPSFDEELTQPGSVVVSQSNACLLLVYARESSIPYLLAHDEATGYDLLKMTLIGNFTYGSRASGAIIDDQAETVTRVDFDRKTGLAHFTKWKLGWFGNKMIYNYHVECRKD